MQTAIAIGTMMNIQMNEKKNYTIKTKQSSEQQQRQQKEEDEKTIERIEWSPKRCEHKEKNSHKARNAWSICVVHVYMWWTIACSQIYSRTAKRTLLRQYTHGQRICVNKLHSLRSRNHTNTHTLLQFDCKWCRIFQSSQFLLFRNFVSHLKNFPKCEWVVNY